MASRNVFGAGSARAGGNSLLAMAGFGDSSDDEWSDTEPEEARKPDQGSKVTVQPPSQSRASSADCAQPLSSAAPVVHSNHTSPTVNSGVNGSQLPPRPVPPPPPRALPRPPPPRPPGSLLSSSDTFPRQSPTVPSVSSLQPPIEAQEQPVTRASPQPPLSSSPFARPAPPARSPPSISANSNAECLGLQEIVSGSVDATVHTLPLTSGSDSAFVATTPFSRGSSPSTMRNSVSPVVADVKMKREESPNRAADEGNSGHPPPPPRPVDAFVPRQSSPLASKSGVEVTTRESTRALLAGLGSDLETKVQTSMELDRLRSLRSSCAVEDQRPTSRPSSLSSPTGKSRIARVLAAVKHRRGVRDGIRGEQLVVGSTPNPTLFSYNDSGITPFPPVSQRQAVVSPAFPASAASVAFPEPIFSQIDLMSDDLDTAAPFVHFSDERSAETPCRDDEDSIVYGAQGSVVMKRRGACDVVVKSDGNDSFGSVLRGKPSEKTPTESPAPKSAVDEQWKAVVSLASPAPPRAQVIKHQDTPATPMSVMATAPVTVSQPVRLSFPADVAVLDNTTPQPQRAAMPAIVGPRSLCCEELVVTIVVLHVCSVCQAHSVGFTVPTPLHEASDGKVRFPTWPEKISIVNHPDTASRIVSADCFYALGLQRPL
jgi:hypothetical protein